MTSKQNRKDIEMAGIYNSVIVTVNKIFTKAYGRHWYKEDIFDEIFFGGHYGDGKYRLNKNYRRNCILRALMKFEELNNVKTITKEEAKKYMEAARNYKSPGMLNGINVVSSYFEQIMKEYKNNLLEANAFREGENIRDMYLKFLKLINKYS